MIWDLGLGLWCAELWPCAGAVDAWARAEQAVCTSIVCIMPSPEPFMKQVLIIQLQSCLS